MTGAQVTENMKPHAPLIQSQKILLLSSKSDSNFHWSFTTIPEGKMIHETSP